MRAAPLVLEFHIVVLNKQKCCIVKDETSCYYTRLDPDVFKVSTVMRFCRND